MAVTCRWSLLASAYEAVSRLRNRTFEAKPEDLLRQCLSGVSPAQGEDGALAGIR